MSEPLVAPLHVASAVIVGMEGKQKNVASLDSNKLVHTIADNIHRIKSECY